MKSKIYLAIDLKSFYASCECVSRGLDPLTTNLVVADASRTEKTICLAVSPSLKQYGIGGRCRLFEVNQKVRDVNAKRKKGFLRFDGKSSDDEILKKNPRFEVDFLIAPPRMKYYLDISTQIYNIYLKYVSSQDIHVYSIDEVFIDATPYLNTYQLTPKEFAMKMILDIYETTGITATAGIGTNLYLAKVAMDIVAKHKDPDENGVRVAALNEYRYRKLLWNHKPLTDFWRVGKGYEKRLNKLGIDTMGKLCAFSLEHEDVLFKTFGVNAELLIDHAWGYEPCTMEDIKAYKPEKNSIGSGQVLSCGYEKEKAKILVKEMVESLALSLVDKHLVTNKVVLTIGYETNEAYTGETMVDFYGRVLPKSLHKIVHLPQKTNANSILIQNILDVYDRYVDSSLLIHKINVAAIEVIDEKNRGFEQMDLFSNVDEEELKKENDLQKVTLKIKNKYGKNSILKGMDFEKGAKAKERNEQIGGHKA